MNAIREALAALAAAHVRIAGRMTPRRFALVWGGIAAGSLVGALTSPDPLTGLACALVGMVAVAFAWANETGRIRD